MKSIMYMVEPMSSEARVRIYKWLGRNNAFRYGKVATVRTLTLDEVDTKFNSKSYCALRKNQFWLYLQREMNEELRKKIETYLNRQIKLKDVHIWEMHPIDKI